MLICEMHIWPTPMENAKCNHFTGPWKTFVKNIYEGAFFPGLQGTVCMCCEWPPTSSSIFPPFAYSPHSLLLPFSSHLSARRKQIHTPQGPQGRGGGRAEDQLGELNAAPGSVAKHEQTLFKWSAAGFDNIVLV